MDEILTLEKVAEALEVATVIAERAKHTQDAVLATKQAAAIEAEKVASLAVVSGTFKAEDKTKLEGHLSTHMGAIKLAGWAIKQLSQSQAAQEQQTKQASDIGRPVAETRPSAASPTRAGFYHPGEMSQADYDLIAKTT